MLTNNDLADHACCRTLCDSSANAAMHYTAYSPRLGLRKAERGAARSQKNADSSLHLAAAGSTQTRGGRGGIEDHSTHSLAQPTTNTRSLPNPTRGELYKGEHLNDFASPISIAHAHNLNIEL